MPQNTQEKYTTPESVHQKKNCTGPCQPQSYKLGAGIWLHGKVMEPVLEGEIGAFGSYPLHFTDYATPCQCKVDRTRLYAY